MTDRRILPLPEMLRFPPPDLHCGCPRGRATAALPVHLRRRLPQENNPPIMKKPSHSAEQVTDPADRHHAARPGRVVLDLAAQVLHVHIADPLISSRGTAGKPPRDLPPGEHPPRSRYRPPTCRTASGSRSSRRRRRIARTRLTISAIENGLPR